MRKSLVKMLVVAMALMSFSGVASAATQTDDVIVTAVLSENLSIACGADVTINTTTILPETLYEANTTVCTIDTNANAGYTLSAESDNADSTAGLYSAGTLETIAAAASSAVTAGAEGFGVSLVATEGNGTVDEGYDDDADTDVAIQTTADVVLIDADQTANGGDDVTFTYHVSAAGIRAAGSYTTTMTYTAVTL